MSEDQRMIKKFFIFKSQLRINISKVTFITFITLLYLFFLTS